MPDWSRYVRRRLPPLGLSPERESEIAAELAAQLEQAYLEALAEGLGDGEARARACSQISDWSALAAEIRSAEQAPPPPPENRRSGPSLSLLLPDLRYAFRGLRRNPGFAAVAILTLAFGIGGNAAIFTVVDHIALRGLPYPESSRLIDIEQTKTDQPEIAPWCSVDNLNDIRERTRAFESIAGISPVWNVILSGAGETERLESLYVSADFFPMLRVHPALGRLFTLADDNRAQPGRVAILSYGYWMRRFGGSPDVLGKVLTVDSTSATVIGVLPQSFVWRGEPLAGSASVIDLWLPLAANQLARSPRTLRFLKVTGRLKPGVTTQQGLEDIRRVGAALTAEYPEANRGLRFAGAPLEARITEQLRPAVFLLVGSVAFVLLMASANVANLLLARAAGRVSEMALRAALGASSARLISQLVAESAALAFCGGALGILLANVFLRLILAYGPAAMVKVVPISIDLRALVFTTALVLITTILAGLIPAFRGAGRTVAGPLREGRGTTRGNRRIRSALATAQIAIALTLLIGAGLLVRSFLRVMAIDPGFDPRHIVSISTQLPPQFQTPEQRAAAYNLLRGRLMAMPGVESVGAVSRLPMLGLNLSSFLQIEGRDDHGHPPEVEFRAATASYFAVMRIPLKSGRLFDEHDGAVLLIDEALARRYFPGVDPVGRRIRFLADSQGPWYTVLGVVGSTRHFGLETEPHSTIYRSTNVSPLAAPIFVIRTAGDPAAAARTLAETMRSVYSSLPTYNVFTMEDIVARSTLERRFLMWLLACFAAAAALLAGIGVYGAMSQSVAQRTREIGVRIALGAAPADALRLVFQEGMRIASTGLAIGLFLGWSAARLGQSLLYEVRPGDLLVFGAAAAALLAFAALGCWLPAQRATRVDPLITLRES